MMGERMDSKLTIAAKVAEKIALYQERLEILETVYFRCGVKDDFHRLKLEQFNDGLQEQLVEYALRRGEAIADEIFNYRIDEVVAFLGGQEETMGKLSGILPRYDNFAWQTACYYIGELGSDLVDVARKMVTRTLTEDEYVVFTQAVDKYLSSK